MNKSRPAIKRYSRQQLANIYRVSDRTMLRWLRRMNLGPKTSHFYSSDQVTIIFEKLGLP